MSTAGGRSGAIISSRWLKVSAGRWGARYASCLPKLLLSASMRSSYRRLPRPPPRDATSDHLLEHLLPDTTPATRCCCWPPARPAAARSLRTRCFVPPLASSFACNSYRCQSCLATNAIH